MKSFKYTTIALAAVITAFASCKKDDSNDTNHTVTNKQIIENFSANIAYVSYSELEQEAITMQQNIHSFRLNPTDSMLNVCRDNWKSSRKTWEQTEAYLFGPAATENIDPRIDTWPVNFNDLEAIINGSDVLNEAYINNLDDALKGFHPVEYLLFGMNGNKLHTDFTVRELEFLEALALNLNALTGQLADGWNPGISSSFYYDWTTAGAGSTVYTSQLSAFDEMVSAMAGICDEVANGKIAEPFNAQNPSLEESPFSGNSIIDFTNNIKGVQNVYLGKYNSDGKGLEDLVKEHNLSLDGTIKQKIANSITALGNITDPFGTAILTQPIQVQNAIDAINDLKATLEDELVPLVQLHVD
jgi:putative iron-regulated protein